MKGLLFGYLVASLLLFASCATMKERKHVDEMHMSETEMVRYYHKNDTIYQDSVAIGIVQSVEWEYNPNTNDDLVMEISITQINPFADYSYDLIRYVHTRFHKAKVEVNYDNHIKDENTEITK